MSERQEDIRSRVKGRGGDKDTDYESRYSGKGAIFSRLDRDSTDGPIQSIEGWIVFIGNVHDEATEEDITDKFSKFGDIKNIQLPLDRRTGYVKGYAMVEYEKKAQAAKAIEEMNGASFLEKPLKVDWAFKIEKDTSI